jgi:hypothetical protein
LSTTSIRKERAYGCVPKLFSNIGMFQTKVHYGHNSPKELIRTSTLMLKEYAEYDSNEIALSWNSSWGIRDERCLSDHRLFA